MSDERKSLELPDGLARILDGVRRRYLGLKVAEFPVLLVAFIATAWILQATADRLLELSWNVRAVLLSLDGLAALVLLWMFAVPPLRRRLDRKRAALLVERTMPEFRSSLISAVELSEKSAQIPKGSESLVRKLLEDAAREAGTVDIIRQVVPLDRLKYLLKWMAAALVAAVICFVIARPFSPVLLQRILLSKTAFPDETRVTDVTGSLVVMAGSDVKLEAKAEGIIPGSGRLIVSLANGVTETIAVSRSRTEEGLFQHTLRNVREPLGYHFELNDGAGARHQVEVRVPPSLREIQFVQTYPKHTGLPETTMSPVNLRLLAGSKLKILATASEALQSAILEIKGTETAIPLKISGKGKTIVEAELTVPEIGWKSMSVHLTTTGGDISVNDPVYRVDLVTDKPPSVLVLQPKKESLTVVAGAKVPFTFKISDDFGLKRVALVYRVFRPGLGGLMEAAEEGELPILFEEGQKSFTRTMEWELDRLVPAVTIGSTITCWIEADDNKPGRITTTTLSSERTIMIVSEEQKRMELLDLLGERAKDIERLYELQRGMNQKTDDSIE